MAALKRTTMIFGGPRSTRINYIPIDNTTLVNATQISNRIGYFPIYIDKKINNPIFSINITASVISSPGVSGGLPIGIYNGQNGIDNAPLLWSGLVNYGTGIGVYKTSPNIMLNEGFYILASSSNFTGIIGYTAAAPGIKHTKALFGDSLTSIANNFTTTSAFESTGVRLPTTIDGNISGSYSVIAPIVTVEY